jgi:general secretion pathway protein D
MRTREAQTAEKPTPAGPLSADAPAGTLRGAIRIIPDTTRNLLIIEALPSDWHIIQAVLERLDVLTRQVLIEAMIAEITLDDNTSLGLEWASREGQRVGTTLLAGAGGLNYIIGLSDRWTVTLNALASENRVNILSSPPCWPRMKRRPASTSPPRYPWPAPPSATAAPRKDRWCRPRSNTATPASS